MKKIFFLFPIFIWATAAYAADYSVKAGQSVSIDFRFDVRNSDCKNIGYYEYSIRKKPKLGSIVLKKVILKIEKSGNKKCLGKNIPVIAVFYKASKSSKGLDYFSLSAISPSGKHLQYDKTVAVK